MSSLLCRNPECLIKLCTKRPIGKIAQLNLKPVNCFLLLLLLEPSPPVFFPFAKCQSGEEEEEEEEERGKRRWGREKVNLTAGTQHGRLIRPIKWRSQAKKHLLCRQATNKTEQRASAEGEQTCLTASHPSYRHTDLCSVCSRQIQYPVKTSG